jgi:phospholipid/cholesterol/gamma-HCH transport system ATP-binding protein
VSETSQNQGQPKIELQGVTKSFGDNHVLKGVDLRVGAGESLVLIGPSASGKTLILKLIMGLMLPDSGRILIDGVDVARLIGKEREPYIRRMGMLFQQSALFDSQTVWENVAFRLLQDKGLTRAQAKAIALDTLASVGMTQEVADLLPAEISGGMQKRVGFARAIANRPEIVLLDEPTAGLDPIMTNIINDLILDNVRDLGATAVSVTSDLGGARKTATSIAMIYDGRIAWQGPAGQLDDSGNPYVDQFVHHRIDGPIELAERAF